MTRKTLVILAVLAVALAVLVVSIEAMRGGMRGGSGGMGGSGGGAAPVPGGNYGGNYGAPSGGCGNYELPPGNYGPGNYEALEVCVSTDKHMYAEGEPIEIEVTAYNPLESVIRLVSSSGPPLCGPAGYTIDDIGPGSLVPIECAADVSYTNIPPKGSRSWAFTHTEGVFPVEVGRHSVVGWARRQSDPTTIWVTESNAGHMGGGNVDNGGNFDGNYEGNYEGNYGNTGTVSVSVGDDGTVEIYAITVEYPADGSVVIYTADGTVVVSVDPTTCGLIYTIDGIVNIADEVIVHTTDGSGSTIGLYVDSTCGLYGVSD